MVARGNLKIEEGDFRGAIEDYSHYIEIQPRSVAAYLGRAVAKINLGDLDGAIADSKTALTCDLNEPRVGPPWAAAFHWNLAVAYLRQRKLQNALAECDTALRLCPQYDDAYVIRAMVKEGLKDFAGAIADTTAAVRINPKNAKAYCNRAAYKMDAGDFQGAIADCNTALAIRPNDRMTYFNRGNAKLRLQDHTGALTDFDLALQQPDISTGKLAEDAWATLPSAVSEAPGPEESASPMPGNPFGYLVSSGRPEQPAGNQGIGRADAKIYDSRGIAWLFLEEHERALKEFDEALRLDPQDGSIYCARAYSKILLDDLAGAMADYNRAIVLAPTDVIAWRNRGKLKALQGDFAGAERHPACGGPPAERRHHAPGPRPAL